MQHRLGRPATYRGGSPQGSLIVILKDNTKSTGQFTLINAKGQAGLLAGGGTHAHEHTCTHMHRGPQLPHAHTDTNAHRNARNSSYPPTQSLTLLSLACTCSMGPRHASTQHRSTRMGLLITKKLALLGAAGTQRHVQMLHRCAHRGTRTLTPLPQALICHRTPNNHSLCSPVLTQSRKPCCGNSEHGAGYSPIRNNVQLQAHQPEAAKL